MRDSGAIIDKAASTKERKRTEIILGLQTRGSGEFLEETHQRVGVEKLEKKRKKEEEKERAGGEKLEKKRKKEDEKG